MRLFGIRPTTVAIGFGLVAASLGVLGAGSNGPGSTKYEVTAPLLSVGQNPVYACGGFILHTLTGCAGVVVHGVDVGQIPGVESYPWGSRLTPPVQLVGTWDGRALTLTQSPQSAVSATPWPNPCGKLPFGFEPEADMLALQNQVGIDDPGLKKRQIDVLETGPCDGTVGIIVVVADPDTVGYLKSRYHTVTVAGWLEPVNGW